MNVAFKERKSSTRALDAIAEALLLPSGIDGIYARTASFEDIVNGLTSLISRNREPGAEVLRFPPVMSRRQLEKSGYLKSFPHFLGCVCCLDGDEAQIRGAVDRFEAGEDWTSGLSPADLVLSPAACYPVYPLAPRSGQRSVLRPRRQADGGEPGRAGAEIRAAHPGALRGGADGVHELQQSPRPFRHDVEHPSGR